MLSVHCRQHMTAFHSRLQYAAEFTARLLLKDGALGVVQPTGSLPQTAQSEPSGMERRRALKTQKVKQALSLLSLTWWAAPKQYNRFALYLENSIWKYQCSCWINISHISSRQSYGRKSNLIQFTDPSLSGLLQSKCNGALLWQQFIHSTYSSGNTLVDLSRTKLKEQDHILPFVHCLLMGLQCEPVEGGSLHIFTIEVV